LAYEVDYLIDIPQRIWVVIPLMLHIRGRQKPIASRVGSVLFGSFPDQLQPIVLGRAIIQEKSITTVEMLEEPL